MSSIRSSWRSRRIAALLAVASALSAAAMLAAPAHAGLRAAGPVNPATGFPDWYEDGNGLKLRLCLDGPPLCLAGASDFSAPDGEAFWWQAEAALSVGTGTARLVLAQEAAFLDGAGISFGRVRVTITGAAANTTYAITHPFGTASVTTDVNGIGRFSDDVGCADGPCDWNAALGGAIGPFLSWDTRPPNSAPPNGYVGDAITPHQVVGGTNGNAFRVTGGGVDAATDLFTVQGRLAGPPVPVFNAPSAVGFGATATRVPVHRTVTVTSLGVPAADGASNLAFGPIGISGPQASEFALVGDTCSGRALASGQSCALTVQFVPAAAGARAASLDIAHNAAGGTSRIALDGTGANPPAAVAGASAASGLRIARLQIIRRLARTQVLRRGLRVTMRLPAGTEIVRIAIYRVRRGRAESKPVWLAYRVPNRAGLYRLRLDSRTLRRRLKAGLYQLNVTPGVSRRQLGRTTTTRFRITRR